MPADVGGVASELAGVAAEFLGVSASLVEAVGTDADGLPAGRSVVGLLQAAALVPQAAGVADNGAARNLPSPPATAIADTASKTVAVGVTRP